MNKHRQILIYPYHKGVVSFTAYMEQLNENYEIASIVAPMGTCLCNHDASRTDNRYPMNLMVDANIEEAFEKCDTLLITSGEETDDIHKSSIAVIYKALERKKDVICCMTLSKIQEETFIKSFEEKNLQFIYLGDEEIEKIEAIKVYNKQPFYKAQKAVIFVGGIHCDIQVNESAMAIIEGIRKSGFKVSGIIEGYEARVLGLHTLPKCMDVTKSVNCLSITSFNSLIRYIEEVEIPDVIVIQLPGNIMRPNSLMVGDYGLAAYMINRAVRPDYIHMCTTYEYAYGELINQASNIVKQVFSYPYGIDSIHVANAKNVMRVKAYDKNFVHTYLPMQFIEERIQSLKQEGVSAYNVLNKKDRQLLCQQIISTLT